jgi:hypothetical protein
MSAVDITKQTTVPSPLTLLMIQAGGGVLAFIPIVTLKQFAALSDTLYLILAVSAFVNVVLSTLLLVGIAVQSPSVIGGIGRIGELGLCRILIFYDMVMLGSLVYLTGGPDESIFAPQAAAVLPMAMLIKDSAFVKWGYAAVFLLMFLVGLHHMPAFQGYQQGTVNKSVWFIVFFFLFTLFPVVYSIQTERTV